MTKPTVNKQLAASHPRRGTPEDHRSIRELAALDKAIYESIATVPTPSLDRNLARLSNAANHSKIWLITGKFNQIRSTNPPVILRPRGRSAGFPTIDLGTRPAQGML